MRFDEKRVFITGSTGYIGRRIMQAFVNEGAIVSVCGRALDNCEEIAYKICEEKGPNIAYPIAFDVGDYLSVEEAMDEFSSKAGDIDILVNCAGGGSRGNRSSLDMQNIELVREIIDVNLMGTIYCCKEALKHFNSQGGNIINVTSILGHNGMELYSEYSAAKGGVIAFTKALAKELGGKNIRVNSISYGLISREELYGEQRLYSKHTNYLNKVPTTEEIVSAVLYLASDEAGYITGADLVVDGGRSLALKGTEEGRNFDDLRDYDFAIQCMEKIEIIKRDAAGRKIYIFGVGHGGEILAKQLINNGVRIAGFYDKKAEELDSFMGLPVHIPQEATGKNPMQYIVISLMNHHYDEAMKIAQKLYNIGFTENDMRIIAENTDLRCKYK